MRFSDSPALEGCTGLDLGCGSGRDTYLVSRLVGPDGFVIGVDMTGEQLAGARHDQDSQAKRLASPKPMSISGRDTSKTWLR